MVGGISFGFRVGMVLALSGLFYPKDTEDPLAKHISLFALAAKLHARFGGRPF